MISNITLTEVQEALNQATYPGLITRVEVDKIKQYWFKHEDCTVALLPNYLVKERYSPTQKVQLHGYCFTVWVDHHRSSSQMVQPGMILEPCFHTLKSEALKQCEHKNSRELSMQECQQESITHYGVCWHVYECKDCGQFYSTDSSG